MAFEKNVHNVSRAAKDMKINYPIAIDSNYAIWRALNNQYWPALYFVTAAVTVTAASLGMIGPLVQQVAPAGLQLPIEGELPSLGAAFSAGFLIPPRTSHNARDLGPETGRMLSTYIVETGQPIATFVDDRVQT
jgi:hypothetical protein